MDRTNLRQAVTAGLTTTVKERIASEGKHFEDRAVKDNWKTSTLALPQQMTGACRYGDKTHIFVRSMWEHRRLVVVHAFISEVVIDYLDELYKFLSSTKHAFCHLGRERAKLLFVMDKRKR